MFFFHTFGLNFIPIKKEDENTACTRNGPQKMGFIRGQTKRMYSFAAFVVLTQTQKVKTKLLRTPILPRIKTTFYSQTNQRTNQVFCQAV